MIVCPQDRVSRTQTESDDDGALLASESTSWLKGALQLLASRGPRIKGVDFTHLELMTGSDQAARAVAATTPTDVRSFHGRCVTVLEAVERDRIACPLPPRQ